MYHGKGTIIITTATNEPRRGFLNSFQLKVIMAVLMVLDHVVYILGVESLTWGHYLARVVAPVFAFLMTEGMRYTRSRGRYIARMLGFGAAMLAGTVLLKIAFGTIRISGGAIVSYEGYTAFNGRPILPIDVLQSEARAFTIFIALGLSAAIIAAVDRLRAGEPRPLMMLAVVGLTGASLFFEGGPMLPMMAVIFYYLRGKPAVMSAVYVAVFGALYGGAAFLMGGGLSSLSPQFYMIFALIPIFCYSGERGPSGKAAKYFFYAFYPLHIWSMLVILRFVLS